MKYFGTVSSFDDVRGTGEIKPENGGDLLRFERTAFNWGTDKTPKIGQRLSYDPATNDNRQPCAVNLAAI